jgi:hypothetical protein
MKTVKLLVGSEGSTSWGKFVENTREVEFKADLLGEVELPVYDRDRGIKQELYRTSGKQLIVYTYEWTNWQGETSWRSIAEVSNEHLGPNGRYEALGLACGFGRPLTLDEALNNRRVKHD